MTAYKVLAHDYCPPVQGGDPVWDGETLPFALPKVRLDKSARECAAGWNYTTDLSIALRIGGLWKSGRPSCCLYVEPSDDAIQRGDKHRCSQLTIIGRVSREEVIAAIRKLSDPFGVFADRMAESQLAWYDALGRPNHNVRKVETGLRRALKARGLDWKFQRLDTARAAWAAWDARAAWAAWDAWDAWDARVAWDAWDAWAARAAWAAWAARAAWDAWAARAAWDALTVEYAALNEWTQDDPLLLTEGLRDAYAAGLEIALPIGSDTLGWVMS